MNHRAYSGFIDPQAESHRAHHDAHFIGHPFFLVLAPRGAFHLAVIADGRDTVFLQEIDCVSHARDCRGVDDDAAVRDSLNGAQQPFILRFCVTLANDVSQISAAKTRDVFVRIAQAKLLDDVVPDALRGAGGESSDGTIRKKFAEAAELPILRPEVVAPFGDAMRLVDGEERNRHASKPRGRAIQGDTLGRKVEQPIVTLACAAKDGAPLLSRKRTIQETSGDSHLLELRHLVLHQRDQRGDHHHRSLRVEHCGQLVAERFAPASGHDDASIASCRDTPDDVLLARAERFVAPVAMQGLEEAVRLLYGQVLVRYRWDQGCQYSVSFSYGRSRSAI